MLRSFGYILLSIAICIGIWTDAEGSDSQAVTRQRLANAELVRRAAPGTVTISVERPDGSAASGTGFIVGSEGTVITNLHVVQGATKVTVRLANGDAFDRVTVRAYDQAKDIAILRVPGFALPIVQLGNSDTVRQGDSVVLIGNPEGLVGSVSAGIISAIRQLDGYRVFQTDAAASSGSSGGPMLDETGTVVGIVTFKVTAGESLNFVVPINYARGLLSIDDGLTLAQLNTQLGLSLLTPRPNATPAQLPPGAAPVSVKRATRVFMFRKLNDRFVPDDSGSLIDLLRQVLAGVSLRQPDSWPVEHDHSEDFRQYCRGTFSVSSGRVAFRSQNGSESFDVSLEAVAGTSQRSRFGTFSISILD